jgi:hypothetical protein
MDDLIKKRINSSSKGGKIKGFLTIGKKRFSDGEIPQFDKISKKG